MKYHPCPNSNIRLAPHLLSALLVLLSSASTFAANRTWNSTGSSADWSSTTNWGGLSAPGSTILGNADTATFNTAIVGTVGTSSDPVIFDSAWALKYIVFDTASVGAFTLGTTSGNALNMSIGGSITVNSGVTNTQTINAPLVMASNTGGFTLTNNATSASTLLNIGGTISASGTATNPLVLSGSNTGNNTISGVIDNGTFAVSLTKSGTGTWVLANQNTYTGQTAITGGNLVLDFAASTAPVSNIISSSSALQLGASGSSAPASQTLTINGKAGQANSQTFGNVSLFFGASHINLNAGSGGTLALTLGSLPGTNTGTSLDFALSSGASVFVGTASNATSGLLANAITINGTDFATNQGSTSNALVGLATVSGYNTSASLSGLSAKPLDVQGDTSITANASMPAMRINQAAANTITIASGATLSLNSTGANGTILVTSNVGANKTIITGGTLAGANSRSLTLVQNNTLGSLQIDSVISGPNLTKSGSGLAVLTGANTYTGVTVVNEGTLQFAREVSLYNNTASNWTTSKIFVAGGATLALNVGGSGEFTTSDVATISGLGSSSAGFLGGAKLGLDTTSGDFTHSTAIANTNSGANVIGLRKLGANTLTLTGANTYTGGTGIEQGKLALTQNFSMGSTSANSISILNAAGSTAGTDYGQLVFSGTTLTYGGSLTLNLTGTIGTDTIYDLISFTSGSGAGNFSSVSISGSYLATLTSSGGTWTGSSDGVDFSFDTTTGDLTATLSSVPEPSTWAAILGAAALSAAMITRRRK